MLWLYLFSGIISDRVWKISRHYFIFIFVYFESKSLTVGIDFVYTCAHSFLLLKNLEILFPVIFSSQTEMNELFINTSDYTDLILLVYALFLFACGFFHFFTLIFT